MWFCLLISSFWSTGAVEERPRAELHVSGYGLIGNLRLKRMLDLLQQGPQRREFFDPNFIEDGALILISRLQRDGHLKPRVTAHLKLEDGSHIDFTWNKPIRDEPLPRPLSIREVEFHIEPGVLYYFNELHFGGLTSLDEKRARSYFVEVNALFHFKRTRIFSKERLDRGVSSLVEALNRRGFESADAKVIQLEKDEKSGQVDVLIEIREGKKSVVRSIREEFYFADTNAPAWGRTIRTNVPYSRLWLQDLTQQLRATNLHQGYPDTKVDTSETQRQTTNDLIAMDLLLQVRSGPQVRLGKVRFEGQKKTKESLLEQRVRLKEGEWLDLIRAEEARNRLARLGVFDSVGLTYDTAGDAVRDVVYHLKEGKTIDVSLLLGWGSYELARGGLEVNQNNLFGRAHHARLLLTQSVKASYGEYVYTIPELIGHDVDLFFNGSALRREEISFTREEYGGGFGARKFVKPIDSDVTLRYSYQVLNATAPGLPVDTGLADASVGAVITEIRHDEVDSPLYPRKGYRTFGNFEIGSEYFGGDVNYQRVEIGGSFHTPLDSARWLHLGIAHGAILSIGSPERDLPFNRRFFPGGDTSIRGYQQGEAAPRDDQGKIVGAESYLFGSIEFEQALTSTWSLVGFLDTVSFARKLEDYPFNETLYSVGAGISWKTIVGPIRLEYGYNLNRREHDPAGTLQFSIGFPF